MHYIQQFKQESRQLHHRRVHSMLLVGIGTMLLFTALDYLLVPEHFSEFLRYRFVAVGFGCLLMVVNYYDQKQRKAWVIGFAGYISASIVILLTTHRMGGVTSPYYVGLIVAMTIYTALAPLTTAQTLTSGFTLVCMYLVSIFLVGTLDQNQLMNLFSNLFFMVCFIFIAATQSWADTAARKQECLLRAAENEAGEALTRQADKLEEEIILRTKEQKISEERYRILYEAIVDDIVLVSPQGMIMQANNSYIHHYHGDTLPANASFFDVVRAQDRERVQTELLEKLEQGQPVSACQLTLLSVHQHPVEVEISGALLRRGEKDLGLQLVIRDIGIRRELEQRLITSLNIVKQTENAAILALAKLSEYREVTPGNHLERIREYCRIIAVELSRHPEFLENMPPSYIQNLYQGVILHDVGKVAIPDAIHLKKGLLTKLEEESLRNHTLTGGDMIKAMEKEAGGSGFLSLAKNVAYFHHERWDGKGYPYGLQGREIPLEARIMALADTYEELTVAIDLEKTLPHHKAVEWIVRKAGQQFDPIIVDAFVAREEDFDCVRCTLAENDTGYPADNSSSS